MQKPFRDGEQRVVVRCGDKMLLGSKVVSDVITWGGRRECQRSSLTGAPGTRHTSNTVGALAWAQTLDWSEIYEAHCYQYCCPLLGILTWLGSTLEIKYFQNIIFSRVTQKMGQIIHTIQVYIIQIIHFIIYYTLYKIMSRKGKWNEPTNNKGHVTAEC